MSTTLTVLHVLLFAHRNRRGDGLLMSSPTPSSLMTSSSTSSLIASLDPVLVDFWSAFPCPPPWNEGLLFRVNWTSCVSQAVGERLRWFLADRCNIPHNDTDLPSGSNGGGGGGGFGGYGKQEGGEACDLSCKILVGLFCFLFVVGVVIGGVFILHRRRSKRKDQRSGQEPTAGGGDRGRTQYAGIHYASASVINREGERPLPPCPENEDTGLPRQLHSYVYNPRDNDHPSADQRLHLHLCPMNRRAAYRAMEHNSNSRDSPSNNSLEDMPHVYDYISDTESVRYRGGSTRGADGHEYTYCTCECSDGGGGSSLAAEYNSSSTPRQSEGYYSDHDHGRQHEVSKPHPRYPEKSTAPGPVKGGKPVPTSSVLGGGLNNNDGSLVLGFRGGLPVDGRHRPDFPVGHGSNIGLPVDSASHTVNDPTASRSRGDNPVNNGTHRNPPVDNRPNNGPADDARPNGDGLRFENAHHDNRTATRNRPGSNHDYEYPEPPLNNSPDRANALALHPQYFTDYFDGGTSSV